MYMLPEVFWTRTLLASQAAAVHRHILIKRFPRERFQWGIRLTSLRQHVELALHSTDAVNWFGEVATASEADYWRTCATLHSCGRSSLSLQDYARPYIVVRTRTRCWQLRRGHRTVRNNQLDPPCAHRPWRTMRRGVSIVQLRAQLTGNLPHGRS
ncbi:hypothetical protein BKA93DRAFT_263369 [Sparassis latifolia]